MTTTIEPGDWVHACNSKYFDLSSVGAVGVFLRKWSTLDGDMRYVVGPKLESYAYGSYRHMRRISKAEAREIKKAWRELYKERQERMYGPRPKPLREEIWEFLRGSGAGQPGVAVSDDADGTGLRLSGVMP